MIAVRYIKIRWTGEKDQTIAAITFPNDTVTLSLIHICISYIEDYFDTYYLQAGIQPLGLRWPLLEERQ